MIEEIDNILDYLQKAGLNTVSTNSPAWKLVHKVKEEKIVDKTIRFKSKKIIDKTIGFENDRWPISPTQDSATIRTWACCR